MVTKRLRWCCLVSLKSLLSTVAIMTYGGEWQVPLIFMQRHQSHQPLLQIILAVVQWRRVWKMSEWEKQRIIHQVAKKYIMSCFSSGSDHVYTGFLQMYQAQFWQLSSSIICVTWIYVGNYSDRKQVILLFMCIFTFFGITKSSQAHRKFMGVYPSQHLGEAGDF